MKKKTTLGMFLLGAMVLSKAYLLRTDDTESIVSRDQSSNSAFSETLITRSAHYSVEQDFLASNFTSSYNIPIYSTVDAVISNGLTERVLVSEIIEPTSDIGQEEIAEEIMPLDVVSNTGYGLWKSSEEKILSKEDRSGSVPLDAGNTISDSMSKLFPRTH